ncbi:hypothetical protein [Mycobacteroides abscessus]|uniref:hypothetical protein n=1 Tax=Mycobacteroides abscessus TaxID=36809 RepID=UPI00092A2747|nr:hypothetical protein [Mycobacteroides abscessus]SIJ31129.1 Uncharacterised protein [Mycobacteroides abscessus subsp. abscessus]SIM17491.1 Uncharacterised protein [Mycobacteroides abscessus subsp. abscessus]SLE58367.1 Uncharacterised protein [Mycobacteroides abscessus subsp. abscessus]
MTVELLDWEAPNGIEVLLAWLAPLDGVCGPDRPTGDGWPYRQVTRVTGPDDKVTDFGLYSVHTFATGPDKEAAFTAAADAPRSRTVACWRWRHRWPRNGASRSAAAGSSRPTASPPPKGLARSTTAQANWSPGKLRGTASNCVSPLLSDSP